MAAKKQKKSKKHPSTRKFDPSPAKVRVRDSRSGQLVDQVTVAKKGVAKKIS